MNNPPILALELLGTVLIPGRGGLWDSRVRPESRRLLAALMNHCHILIHTVLVSDDNQLLPPEEQATRVEQYLRAIGIPWDWVWCRPGKPQADYYAESLDDLQRFHDEILSSVPPGSPTKSIQPEEVGVPGVPPTPAASRARPVQTQVAAR